MDLKDDLLDEFNKFARERRKVQACPVCLETKWVAVGITDLGDYQPGGSAALGGPVVPVATIKCDNCGYIQLFGAVHTGLIKKLKEQNPLMLPQPSEPVQETENA